MPGLFGERPRQRASASAMLNFRLIGWRALLTANDVIPEDTAWAGTRAKARDIFNQVDAGALAMGRCTGKVGWATALGRVGMDVGAGRAGAMLGTGRPGAAPLVATGQSALQRKPAGSR